ncbi:MAG: DNA-3-methyladenine glycosylase I [Gammaproteobacteria bacterium]|nr:MAG: DNA-3-methyladenine glycosylase I [Gammaproteobacteria bacterium]RLA52407.1 MAG: DNA-3-methyladenine glycosylase I [Gammaproteobacteria bacterium]
MISFESLLTQAIQKKGGFDQLKAWLPDVKNADELRQIPDDRYLSEISRCVFRAGFSWKVIDKKWPDFETVFVGFNPFAIAHYSDDKLAELVKDKRIVRHAAKIKSVRDNAVFICDVQQSHGSYGAFIADWPCADITGLWLALKKRGSRLGGNSGPMSLRLMGKDTFILTADVQAALVNHKLVDSANPNTKRDLASAQAVFNRFQQESGYPLAHISRILALSV